MMDHISENLMMMEDPQSENAVDIICNFPTVYSIYIYDMICLQYNIMQTLSSGM